MDSTREGTIEKYLPHVRRYAIRFMKGKCNSTAYDIEDMIQAAYMAVVEFIARYGFIDETNEARLILHVKYALIYQAWELCPMRVPHKLFLAKHREIAERVMSLDELIEAVGVENAAASVIGRASDITADERIDLDITVNRMPQKCRDVYRIMSTGATVTEVAAEMGDPYSTTHDTVSKMRAKLKQGARLHFLVPACP